jgi:hypothetical protein
MLACVNLRLGYAKAPAGLDWSLLHADLVTRHRSSSVQQRPGKQCHEAQSNRNRKPSDQRTGAVPRPNIPTSTVG